MPIYEYLCPNCNRVYSFLAQSVTVTKEPTCPKCGATNLRKMVSRFAFVRSGGGAKETADAEGGPPRGGGLPGEPDPYDDPRVEREMMRLLGDAENLDENDPRQLGRLMRRMSEITGEPLEPEMEEAMRRLEAGEDPDKVEEDMGDLFGEGGGPGGPPSYDDDLYPM
jgi:putative FmdB family regulatory protein